MFCEWTFKGHKLCKEVREPGDEATFSRSITDSLLAVQVQHNITEPSNSQSQHAKGCSIAQLNIHLQKQAKVLLIVTDQ